MSDNLNELIKSFSKGSKDKISNFIEDLFGEKDKTEEQSTEDYLFLEQVFTKVTAAFSIEKARQASKNERSFKLLNSNQYNYGQIKFRSIYKVIKRISQIVPLGKHEIFYDLGSGSGKVIFAASLCHSFQKCIGIEVLESLYQYSLQLKNKIQTDRNEIENSIEQENGVDYQLPIIQIHNRDFKDVHFRIMKFDWSNATIAFVSSTCYSNEVMHEVARLSAEMNKGTFFVTLTKKLDPSSENCWKVVDKFQGESSWGSTTIYIQRKII